MDNLGNEKSEKAIINELKEVHESIEKDPNKQFDPDEVKLAIDGLAEQVQGSDADSDQSVAKNIDETEKQKENEGSDAGRT